MRVIARDAVADAQLREDLRDALGAEKVADLIAKGSRLDPRAMYATVERRPRAHPIGAEEDVTMKVLMVLIAAVGMAACNPLTTDPVSSAGRSSRRPSRTPDPMRAGCASRSTVLPVTRCTRSHSSWSATSAAPSDGTAPVRGGFPATWCWAMSAHRTSASCGATAAQAVRLMTVWSGETAQVALVCVDPETQELGCPNTVRTRLSVVDEDGRRVGDLQPGVLGP